MSIDFVVLSKTRLMKNAVPENDEVLRHLKEYIKYLHDCTESYILPVPFTVAVTGSDRVGNEVIGHVTANSLARRYDDYGQDVPLYLVSKTGLLYKFVRSYVTLASRRRADIWRHSTDIEETINNLTADSWTARYNCPPKDLIEQLHRLQETINRLNAADSNAGDSPCDV